MFVIDNQSRDSATRPQAARRSIEVRFLAGTRQGFFLDELPAILRHPVVLLYFAGSIVACFAVSVLLDRPSFESYVLLFPILAVAYVTGMLSFVAWVQFKARINRGTGATRIFLTPPLIVCIVIVQAVVLLGWKLVLDVPAAPLETTALAVVLIYVLDELMLHFIVSPRTGTIIDDVRTLDGTLPPRRPEVATLIGAGRPVLVSGALTLPVDTVLRLQAQGNYVLIWTDTANFTVPGPFAHLTAQLPDGLGCLVHRSEWVATRAVTCLERKGRAIELRLSNGNLVRVASTRAGVVRDWLAQFDAKLSRRRSASSGGGEAKRHSRPAP